jgi:hypothetical protein
MTKTKIILVTLAMSLVLMAAVGVTYAQYVNTQNQTSAYSQTPQGYVVNYGYLPPNSGSGYSQVPQQGDHSDRMGMGMGMMGRGW